MKKDILRVFIVSVLFALSLSSCKKTLDLAPTNGVTVDIAYSTPAGYKQGFAKLYGAFALTGNQGGAGQPDIGRFRRKCGRSDRAARGRIGTCRADGLSVRGAIGRAGTKTGIGNYIALKWMVRSWMPE